MKFSDAVLQYYKQLQPPQNLPDEVEVLNPFERKETFDLAAKFYHKYYSDEAPRFLCLGINPGRFGAGLTGVPFTDPVRLQEVCGIDNSLDPKPELSSRFIYDMIGAFGPVGDFYSRFYISAVSPLGYTKDGINLNYYDIKGYKTLFEQYAVEQIKIQFDFGLDTRVAFSIGKGKNAEFLNYLNAKYELFDEIVALSHPRWVMQYRLKRKDEFIEEYLQAFQRYLS